MHINKQNTQQHNIKNSCFVTGCDTNYEWALPWWYDNFQKHNVNKYNLVFADLGMSKKALDWCSKRGQIITSKYKFNIAWFMKPLILSNLPYQYGIWIDLDCEIRRPLDDLARYATKGFSVTLDKWALYFCQMKSIPVATGVIATPTNNKILLEWVDYTINNYKNFRGDQEILNEILKKYCYSKKKYKDVIIMTPYWQWLRLDGDNPNAFIMHWTGSKGNEIIRQQIINKKINDI